MGALAWGVLVIPALTVAIFILFDIVLYCSSVAGPGRVSRLATPLARSKSGLRSNKNSIPFAAKWNGGDQILR